MNYTQTIGGPMAPTANLAVNKSRLKVYKNVGELPTYYLQKGQEFSIELFNPTRDVILAKIILNGKPISQGGLVLNPGQRVYLERYLDVAKKFLFDTYEIDSSKEAQNAIVQNGDFKVTFHKEMVVRTSYFDGRSGIYTKGSDYYPIIGNTNTGSFNCSGANTTTYNSTTTSINNTNTTFTSFPPLNLTGLNNSVKSTPISHDGSATIDWISTEYSRSLADSSKLSAPIKKMRSAIETGRVEQGAVSEQKIKTIDKTFDPFAFHNVEYKMLPTSQKINTTSDINIKRYCVNCGAKLNKTDKFCSKCGNKA